MTTLHIRAAEALEVFELEHADCPGLQGLMMGFAAGRMMAMGATKPEIRAIFEVILGTLPGDDEKTKAEILEQLYEGMKKL
jgi:hypothetical protein